MLYGPPGPYKGRGRRPQHGPRFALKQPDTWGEAAEVEEFEDDRWGQVRLSRWHNMHKKQDAQTTLSVIRAEVHLEREKPPAAL